MVGLMEKPLRLVQLYFKLPTADMEESLTTCTASLQASQSRPDGQGATQNNSTTLPGKFSVGLVKKPLRTVQLYCKLP